MKNKENSLIEVIRLGKGNQRLSKVKKLIESGADSNEVELELRNTPIFGVVELKVHKYDSEVELAEILINAKANLKHVNKLGMTVLDFALDMHQKNTDNGLGKKEYYSPSAGLKKVLKFLVVHKAKTKLFKQKVFDSWAGI